jgi:hypothetical protein
METTKPKSVECPYWIVNSKEEKEIIQTLTGYHWPEIGHKFPYIIGREPMFSFQGSTTQEMNDYLDKDENIIYHYVLKTI